MCAADSICGTVDWNHRLLPLACGTRHCYLLDERTFQLVHSGLATEALWVATKMSLWPFNQAVPALKESESTAIDKLMLLVRDEQAISPTTTWALTV